MLGMIWIGLESGAKDGVPIKLLPKSTFGEKLLLFLLFGFLFIFVKDHVVVMWGLVHKRLEVFEDIGAELDGADQVSPSKREERFWEGRGLEEQGRKQKHASLSRIVRNRPGTLPSMPVPGRPQHVATVLL